MDLMFHKPVSEPVNFTLIHTHSNYSRIMETIVKQHHEDRSETEILTPRSLRSYLQSSFDIIQEIISAKENDDDVDDGAVEDDESINTADHTLDAKERSGFMRRMKRGDGDDDEQLSPRAEATREFESLMANSFHKLLKDGILFAQKQEREKQKKLQTARNAVVPSTFKDASMSEEAKEHLQLLTKQVATRDEFIERLERKISNYATKLDLVRYQCQVLGNTHRGMTKQSVDEMKASLMYFEFERQYLYARLIGEGKDLGAGAPKRSDIEKLIASMKNQHDEQEKAEHARKFAAKHKREIEQAVEKANFNSREKAEKAAKKQLALQRKMETFEEQFMIGYDPLRPDRGGSQVLLKPELFESRREEIISFIFGEEREQNEWFVDSVVRSTSTALETFGQAFGGMNNVMDTFSKGKKRDAYSMLAEGQRLYLEARNAWTGAIRDCINTMRDKPNRSAKSVQVPEADARAKWTKDKGIMASGPPKSSGSDSGHSKTGKTSARRESTGSDSEAGGEGMGKERKANIESMWKAVFIAQSRLLGTVRNTLRIGYDEVSIFEAHLEEEEDPMVSSMKQLVSTLNAHRIVLENIRLPFDLIGSPPENMSPRGTARGNPNTANGNPVVPGSPRIPPADTLDRKGTGVSQLKRKGSKAELSKVEEVPVVIPDDSPAAKAREMQLRNAEARVTAALEKIAKLEKQLAEARARGDVVTVTKVKKSLQTTQEKKETLQTAASEIKKKIKENNQSEIDVGAVLLSGVGVKHQTLELVAAMRTAHSRTVVENLEKVTKEAELRGDVAMTVTLGTQLELAKKETIAMESQSVTLKVELAKVPDIAKEEEEERKREDKPRSFGGKNVKIRVDTMSPRQPESPLVEPGHNLYHDFGEDEEAHEMKAQLQKDSVEVGDVFCAQCCTKMSCRFCHGNLGLVPLKALRHLIGTIGEVSHRTSLIAQSTMKIAKENVSLKLLREKYDNDPNSKAVQGMLDRGENMKKQWEARKQKLTEERKNAFLRLTAAYTPVEPQPVLVAMLSTPKAKAPKAVVTRRAVDTTKPISYQDFLKVQTGGLRSMGLPKPLEERNIPLSSVLPAPQFESLISYEIPARATKKLSVDGHTVEPHFSLPPSALLRLARESLSHTLIQSPTRVQSRAKFILPQSQSAVVPLSPRSFVTRVSASPRGTTLESELPSRGVVVDQDTRGLMMNYELPFRRVSTDVPTATVEMSNTSEREMQKISSSSEIQRKRHNSFHIPPPSVAQKQDPPPQPVVTKPVVIKNMFRGISGFGNPVSPVTTGYYGPAKPETPLSPGGRNKKKSATPPVPKFLERLNVRMNEKPT